MTKKNKKPNSQLSKEQHLSHYKVPKLIEWTATLPKSTVGKILKTKLS